MSVSTTVKKYGIEQAIKFMYKDPEKNLPKLMDWADTFCKGRFPGQRAAIRRAIEDEKPDGYLLGEVWEDGSNKVAYSQRRRYLLGRETHGLMNYPLRTALLRWLGGGDAAEFRESMETLRANYPPAAFYGAMNFLGTHDTPRILTLLGAEHIPAAKEERAAFALSPAQLARGRAKLRLAGMLLYGFPGSPTLFYGDEAGMQGFEDPLNRATYPWGCEDAALLALYRRLGQLRRGRTSLQSGSIAYLAAEGGVLAILRQSGAERTLTALNAGDTPAELALPWADTVARSAIDHVWSVRRSRARNAWSTGT